MIADKILLISGCLMVISALALVATGIDLLFQALVFLALVASMSIVAIVIGLDTVNRGDA